MKSLNSYLNNSFINTFVSEIDVDFLSRNGSSSLTFKLEQKTLKIYFENLNIQKNVTSSMEFSQKDMLDVYITCPDGFYEVRYIHETIAKALLTLFLLGGGQFDPPCSFFLH